MIGHQPIHSAFEPLKLNIIFKSKIKSGENLQLDPLVSQNK